MNKKRVSLAFLVLVVTTSAFAISRTIAQKTTDQGQGQATVSSPTGLKPKPTDDGAAPKPAQPTPSVTRPASLPEEQSVPQYIVYGQMFRHIKELKRQADEEERQGRDGNHFRTLYQRMANLDDREAAALEQVATETNNKIEPLNKRAKEIIDGIRAQHPDGKLAQGESLPEPPAELRQLSEQRREIILQAREKLHAAFGDMRFSDFDKFVQQRVKAGIRPLNGVGTPHRPQGQ
jgi:hypothetical protein